MTDWSGLEQAFSTPRLGRYLRAFGHNQERAHRGYIHNLQLSESLLVPLSVLEIALRNAMSGQMAKLYKRDDWYEAILTDTSLQKRGTPLHADKALKGLHKSIHKAKRDAGSANPNKLIAEFSFGFWTTLLNTKYQNTFWKELKYAFPHCPQRQRHTVSSALNQIRGLRNRVFHHEPVLWMMPPVEDHHRHLYDVLTWLNHDIAPWVQTFDRFPGLLPGRP